MAQSKKFISLLTGPPTAKMDVIVQLPEGNYAAHAVLGPLRMFSDRDETVVEIIMQKGHEIPVGPEQHFPWYQVLAPTFDKALEELISKVRSHRFASNFSAPPFALSVKVLPPTPNGPPVRLRKLDGTTTQVPGGTKAIPIVRERTAAPASPQQYARIEMTGSLRAAFDRLAGPIERFAGRTVLYEPTPGAAELHEAIVEGEPGPTAG